MSTRATYQFVDERESYTVYKQDDNYPAGALRFIALTASEKAWSLPRFVAAEFAAAFVAATKHKSGGVYLCQDGKEVKAHPDTDYHYTVSCVNGEIWVSIEQRAVNPDTPPVFPFPWSEDIVSGSLNDLLGQYK